MINLLGTLRVLRGPVKLEPKALDLGGRVVLISFKRNARCKRMVLRLSPDGTSVVLTLPSRTSLAEAMRFAETSKPWIVKTMAAIPSTVPFKNESQILLEGKLHTIIATGGRRGAIAVSSTFTITVPGDDAHVPRRLTDWLKIRAKVKLQETSLRYAAAMGVKFRKLTVRDQKSRWGSCSAAGDLSYSWRLILAPTEVLDYVAAHEVAHLKEMNHGPRFWRLVITHCKSAKEARRWLREHGRELHKYGPVST